MAENQGILIGCGTVKNAYRITAHWDAEARVWWAESQDVKGLVAEANTLDALVEDLRQTVPDLLQLNHGIDPATEPARPVY